MSDNSITNRKVVFFGGKPISARCLEALHQRQILGDLEILAVVPRPKGFRGWWSGEGIPEVYETAERLGLSIVSQEDIPDIPADIGISVLYYRILPPEVMHHFRNGIINFHPAPLPHYRGANAASHALMKGESRFGASMHFINEGVDKGDVVEVRWFDVHSSATSREVTCMAESTIERMFDDWLPGILADDLPAIPQNVLCQQLGVKPGYHPRTSLDNLRQVDFGWPPERIWNHVRALDFPPFEPAYTMIGDRKVYLRCSTWEPRSAAAQHD